MSKESYFERVEAYYEGRLSAKEMQDFELESATNTELQLAMDKYKIAKESLDVLSEESLKSKFNAWREEQHETTQNTETKIVEIGSKPSLIQNISLRVRWIAAAVLILIMAYPVYYWLTDSPGSPDYFVSLSEPMEGEISRSGAPAAWINGMEAYEQKDFQKSIDLLESLEAKNDRTRFYIGHNYYLQSKYNKAEEQFRAIIEIDQSVYKEEAEWALLACVYHKEAQSSAFITLLNHILENKNHSFYKEALELEKGLE